MRALAAHLASGPGRVSPLSVSVDPVTEENWLVHAMRAYDNPSCASTREFYDDMKRFKYIRKLLTQYERGGELKERLILNHLILLGNVIGPELLVRLIFLKMREHAPVLLPFLILLSIIPDTVRGVGVSGEDIMTDEIPLDPRVVAALRNI